MQILLRMHGWAFRARHSRFDVLSRPIELAIRLVFSARIPAATVIHSSVRFQHNGLAVVLNAETKIGAGCQIGTHVVIGGNPHQKGAPVLEEDVIVCAGAKLVGPIHIGRGAVIAANAVVIADVPAFSLVAGVPAVIKKRNIDPEAYRA